MELPKMTAPKNQGEYIIQKFDKVALVDADFLKYIVASKISGYYNKNGHHPSVEHGDKYINMFTEDVMADYFFKRFKPKAFIFCFSGSSKDTFRYSLSISKEYKGNRGLTEPAYPEMYVDLAKVVGVVAKKYNFLLYENYEADDIVSMLQNEHTFIYSKDKDLLQVPGWHYDSEKNNIYEINERDAVHSLSKQLLIGDTTDNIVGVEKVGDKTAEKILESVASNNKLLKVVDTYVQKYGNIEGLDRFAENWLLVKMRINRPGYERSMLQKAFSMRDSLIN